MGRVYENGRLIRIECDADDGEGRPCTATIAPNPDIAKSGWTKEGSGPRGDELEWGVCPIHSEGYR